MPSLIESILTIENRAASVVQAAHAEAKTLAAKAEQDAARERQQIALDIEQKVAAYKARAEEQYSVAKAQQDAEFRQATQLLERISDTELRPFAESVVTRYQEA
ncbi:MAG: hypothetical protein AMXMBFR84_08730 [Candidatus Hydrogenedentota bacterium]